MLPALGAGVCAHDSAFVLTGAMINDAGFPLHLASMDVMIRRLLPGRWDDTLATAAQVLAAREPQNAFFEWLHVGASDALVARMHTQMPAAGHPRTQWSYSRTDSKQAWRESMGWEFLFLASHMLSGV